MQGGYPAEERDRVAPRTSQRPVRRWPELGGRCCRGLSSEEAWLARFGSILWEKGVRPTQREATRASAAFLPKFWRCCALPAVWVSSLALVDGCRVSVYPPPCCPTQGEARLEGPPTPGEAASAQCLKVNNQGATPAPSGGVGGISWVFPSPLLVRAVQASASPCYSRECTQVLVTRVDF